MQDRTNNVLPLIPAIESVGVREPGKRSRALEMKIIEPRNYVLTHSSRMYP